MIYRKISIKSRLPTVGIFVTAIDEKGNFGIYRMNEDESWTMRDCSSDLSPDNNLGITHWLKPEFSDDEIEHLRRMNWEFDRIGESLLQKSVYGTSSHSYDSYIA